jgi:hypothetical protein
MRAFRVLAVAALVALDVSTASAQSTRHFKDSWFWGVKAGGMFYQVQSDPGGSLAPLAGVDWLITRKSGGLYVAVDYSFFDQSVFVNDSISPVDNTVGGRQVNLRNMYRVTMAGMLFPLQNKFIQPYIGIGAALNSIAETEAEGTFVSPRQENLVAQTILQFKAAASPVFMLGTQLRLPLASAFGQVTATRAYRDFFLYNGPGWRATVEGGLRYNIGSSIDRLR